MVETMSKARSKQDHPQTEVEITPEMRELLADFTPEELKTGVIKGDRRLASGSHTIQDLVDAYRTALLEDTVGAMPRTVRERHQHSLSDAAEVLGVGRARAHQLERPGANLRIDTLVRYASAYGYKLRVELVPEDADEPAIVTELPEATSPYHPGS